MQIVSDKTEFKLKGASAVAIGKFDGIHAGHYRLIDEILRQKKNGLKSVIFTFFPSAAAPPVIPLAASISSKFILFSIPKNHSSSLLFCTADTNNGLISSNIDDSSFIFL